ncbi:MAG: GNAT family N-acetyltransferase [Novosphingobium sp.]
MAEIRQLSIDDAALTAPIHRVSGALIPGYDTGLHTPAEDLEFHRTRVFVDNAVWGAFEGGELIGFIALQPGWIDHLYVRPDRLRRGIGARLVAFAQRQQSKLRLYTFQANARARAFYERLGFVIEELTDGARNEEKMPDITYLWRAS